MNTKISFKGKTFDKNECVYTQNAGWVPKTVKDSIIKDVVTDLPILSDKSGSIRGLQNVIIGGTASKRVYGKTAAKQFAAELFLSSENTYIANEEIAEKLGYVYDPEHYVFTDKKFLGKLGPRNQELRFKFPPKTVTDANPKHYGLSSATFRLTDGLRYTFGVEVETCEGSIPTHARLNLPLNSVYDGSIRNDKNQKVGTEYTTLPLIGDTGFLALKRSLSAMLKYKHVQNKSCSIHVHLGSAEFNKTTVVALWALCQLLEKELFSILPSSRKKSEHCRSIYKILFDRSITPQGTFVEKYYEEMHKIVGCTNDKSQLSKARQHPRGAKCQYDKSTPRYWWVNFVPAMFNMRGNKVYTIEFRNHSASFNYIKIKNWILILMAILNYAENYPQKAMTAKSMTLKHLITKVYGSGTSNILLKYIEARKAIFKGDRDSSEYTTAENKDFPGNNIKSIFQE